MKESESEALRQMVRDSWQALNQPPVGARLLANIQKDIERQFGESLAAGPAAIARMLADEGAELRHPEIIESDAAWRASRIADEAKDFGQIAAFIGQPLTLDSAAELIEELDAIRQRFEHEQNERELGELNALAIQARQAALSVARNAGDELARATQSEIAEWLKVWLQTPNLFYDWFELRKRSDEFRRSFS